jgi:hypothetical protein
MFEVNASWQRSLRVLEWNWSKKWRKTCCNMLLKLVAIVGSAREIEALKLRWQILRVKTNWQQTLTRDFQSIFFPSSSSYFVNLLTNSWMCVESLPTLTESPQLIDLQISCRGYEPSKVPQNLKFYFYVFFPRDSPPSQFFVNFVSRWCKHF